MGTAGEKEGWRAEYEFQTVFDVEVPIADPRGDVQWADQLGSLPICKEGGAGDIDLKAVLVSYRCCNK